MNLAYWRHMDGRAMCTHIVRELTAGDEANVGLPLCGLRHDPGRTNAVRFPGTVVLVECHNCLRIERARARRQAVKCTRRLEGKDGAQADAFMQ